MVFFDEARKVWFLARGQLLSIVWPGFVFCLGVNVKKKRDRRYVSCKQVEDQSMVSLIGSLIVKFLVVISLDRKF